VGQGFPALHHLSPTGAARTERPWARPNCIDVRFACDYAGHMAHVQIRNVPDNVHRTLKARAAKQGMSLSDCLLHEIETLAARPTMEEILERLSHHKPVNPSESLAGIIREERDSR